MGLTAQTKFWGLEFEKKFERCLQFGAYNSGMEANFCTLKTAVQPEENGLQDVCSTLTFDLWM